MERAVDERVELATLGNRKVDWPRVVQLAKMVERGVPWG